jgi:hypothetical protein
MNWRREFVISDSVGDPVCGTCRWPGRLLYHLRAGERTFPPTRKHTNQSPFQDTMTIPSVPHAVPSGSGSPSFAASGARAVAAAGHFPLDDVASDHLYRIAQEAVINAISHGNCTRLDISLAVEESHLSAGRSS